MTGDRRKVITLNITYYTILYLPRYNALWKYNNNNVVYLIANTSRVQLYTCSGQYNVMYYVI